MMIIGMTKRRRKSQTWKSPFFQALSSRWSSSIARAFLKNAPIIILDEIAASLDVENEVKIQESLTKLIKGKTVITISHRLKSVENTDKIVVLENGKINAIGKHEELLNSSNLYKSMVEKSRLTEEFRY